MLPRLIGVGASWESMGGTATKILLKSETILCLGKIKKPKIQGFNEFNA
ncbi:MAG: hypothetical protein ACP5GU_03420 [Thermoprotei archaeon]|jgi:hypothetical protein